MAYKLGVTNYLLIGMIPPSMGKMMEELDLNDGVGFEYGFNPRY